MGGVHMLTPTYEEVLQAFGASPGVESARGAEAGGPISPQRPMHVLLGLVLFLVIIAVLYHFAEKA